MAFYIQKEKDIRVNGQLLNISVQTDDDATFQIVPEIDNVIESSCDIIVIHVPGNFARIIHGNHTRAAEGGIYLISLEKNGDLSVNYSGAE